MCFNKTILILVITNKAKQCDLDQLCQLDQSQVWVAKTTNQPLTSLFCNKKGSMSGSLLVLHLCYI